MIKNNKSVFPMGGAKEWNNLLSVEDNLTPIIRESTSTTTGTSEDNATIEVEKDEVILTPSLEVFKVKGDTHANGGVPYFASSGEFIYSDRIKLPGKAYKNYFTRSKLLSMTPEMVDQIRSTIKDDHDLDLSGLKLSDDKQYSMADIATKFKTNQDLVNLQDEFDQSQLYKKNSSRFNLEGKIKALAILSTLQESLKLGRDIQIGAITTPSNQLDTAQQYELGGEYDLDEDALEDLKQQGYQFDIIK